MDILEKAIEAEGGLGNGGVQQLAEVLGLGGSNVISNWRKRGHIPRGWAAVLQMNYTREAADSTTWKSRGRKVLGLTLVSRFIA